MYEVEYKYRHRSLLADNAIAENIFAQVDGVENRHVLFQYIVEHRYDGTKVKEQNSFITTSTGTKRHSLKDMKNSYPV